MTSSIEAMRQQIGPRQIAYLLSLQDHEPHQEAAQRLLAVALGRAELAPAGEDLATSMNDLMGTCWSEGFQGVLTDLHAVEAHLVSEILIQTDHGHWRIAEQCLDASDGGESLLSDWSESVVQEIRGYMELIRVQRVAASSNDDLYLAGVNEEGK